MAITAQASNHAAYALATGEINLDADTLRVLLMRSGFAFDRDIHALLKNIKTTTGAITVQFAGDKTLTRSTGNFFTDGFQVGNQITTDSATNPGPFTITVVDTLVLTVSEAVSAEGPGTFTIASDDELATGYGYTQDTKELVSVLTEDDALNMALVTASNLIWVASGGSIGPTPNMLIYDYSSTDKVIIGCVDFGAGLIAVDEQELVVSGVKIQIAT